MKQEEFPRFDMSRPPRRQSALLRPLAWLLSFPDVWKHKTRIERANMDGLTAPYLLLCNHNAFLDFKVTTAAIFPKRANYVVAIDGFIGREGLLRGVGCICKRKFTTDVTLVRHLKTALKFGDVLVLYPEARYSLCGTASALPDSTGKLIKLLNVPVVTLMIHGHHINAPFWNTRDRGVRGTQAEMTQIVTRAELGSLSAGEINARIRAAFWYDDFAWQKANGVRIAAPFRAEGLHKVLYQCPHCGAEYRMGSEGGKLFCMACGKSWTMTELGELAADEGETEFSHIPDWYEWERANVRAEVRAGTYGCACRATVQSLPNARGFIPLGEAALVHDMNGFALSGVYEGEPYRVEWSAKTLYSCHIEYEYLGKYGDCVDLNTLTDTYYISPKDAPFSVTKFALATEELYAFYNAAD